MAIELAWAAGFFDGEGTIGCRTAHSPRGRAEGYAFLLMSVKQVRREPLERFAAAVGRGSVTGPYKRKASRHQPVYSWQLGNTGQVREVAALLHPYLCEPKREQIDRAIAEYESRPELPRVIKKRRIRDLSARGLTAREIAQVVGLSVRTIHYHLQTAGEGVH